MLKVENNVGALHCFDKLFSIISFHSLWGVDLWGVLGANFFFALVYIAPLLRSVSSLFIHVFI